MESVTFAKMILATAKEREESYDQGSFKYQLTMEDAAKKHCPPDMVFPVTLALNIAWNDYLEWAESVVEEKKPFWRCQECGFDDHNKPLPTDREKFYSTAKPHKCPRCKSEALMPQGF